MRAIQPWVWGEKSVNDFRFLRLFLRPHVIEIIIVFIDKRKRVKRVEGTPPHSQGTPRLAGNSVPRKTLRLFAYSIFPNENKRMRAKEKAKAVRFSTLISQELKSAGLGRLNLTEPDRTPLGSGERRILRRIPHSPRPRPEPRGGHHACFPGAAAPTFRSTRWCR